MVMLLLAGLDKLGTMNKTSNQNLFQQAYCCLEIMSPVQKVEAVRQLYQNWQNGFLTLLCTDSPVKIEDPGRPEKPVLVNPKQVPQRGFGTTDGRVRLAHAIAHIEFNAINLALDAVYRFRDMPDQFYDDWLGVAFEEACHFTLLNQYLVDNNANYGDYVAHSGLWDMALKTDHDVLIRMALVPRVLEARGLDVTPSMITKLQQVGDHSLVEVLKIIYRDEIGHVQIGSYWFNRLCKDRHCNPGDTFAQLLDEYMSNATFGVFDAEVRKLAGFTQEEMAYLASRRKVVGNF